MTTHLLDDVYWLSECHDDQQRHLHVSAYLITQGGHNTLIDTGSIQHTEEIASAIDRETGGDGVDTLVLSHPDLPHSGNVSEITHRWPDLDLIVFSNTPPLHGFPDAISADRGDELTISGRQFSWIEAPLADVTSTAWVYDHGSNTLFTADGFGHYHPPGVCNAPSTAIPDGIRYEDIHSFNRDVLPWLRYVDPSKLRDTLDDLFAAYQIECIAPVHGNPILRDDLDDYMESFYDSVASIADSYTFPERRLES